VPKKAYHHGNLRPALIKAGLRAIADEGPDGFTLRDVARRVGVSAPAVYRHFRDKEDLLVAIAAECADRLAAMMVEAVANAPADPLERFRATGIAYVRFAVTHPEHFRALSVPGLLARTPPERRVGERQWHFNERRVLEEAQAAGTLAALPLDEILLAAQALMHGLAHMIIEGRFGDVDDAKATELAIAVSRAIGVGFVPRAEEVVDPRGAVNVKPVAKTTSSWRKK
jgi:AcrR family transcriptional regulator